MVEERETINILLVSDVHSHWAQLEKMQTRITDKQFDIVLLSGDQANAQHSVGKEICQIQEKEAIADNQRVIGMMPENVPVYWIPGNHDAEEYFTE